MLLIKVLSDISVMSFLLLFEHITTQRSICVHTAHTHKYICTANFLACLKRTFDGAALTSHLPFKLALKEFSRGPLAAAHALSHAHSPESFVEPAGSQTALTCCLWQPKRRRLAPSTDNMLFVPFFPSLCLSAISYLQSVTSATAFFSPCPAFCLPLFQPLSVSVALCLCVHLAGLLFLSPSLFLSLCVYPSLMPLWPWEQCVENSWALYHRSSR